MAGLPAAPYLPSAPVFILPLLACLPSPSPQWSTIAGVLQLADYFGAEAVIQSADAWLCAQYGQQAEPLKPQQACQAFELAARHRLGGAMALLLPWAVQCMARGSRCSTVW